jgi:hypothetical protein
MELSVTEQSDERVDGQARLPNDGAKSANRKIAIPVDWDDRESCHSRSGEIVMTTTDVR